MLRAILVLAALLGSALVIIQFLWRRARFWKLIAQESQASAAYWRQQYEGHLCASRSPVSVVREGPSRWLDVERLARGE
jgi:hypothetical protein